MKWRRLNSSLLRSSKFFALATMPEGEDAIIDMRCFKFRVRSTLDARDRIKREHRFAHVWVNEKDMQKAEDIARALLASQGWAIESVELSMAPTREEIAR